jgi:hypothetical protein
MAPVTAAWVLGRAAKLADGYDRNAQGEVTYNKTDKFHLCGLIERAASLPKSGATHRRSMGAALIDAAKAQFCLAHGVVHPSSWEWQEKRSAQDVADGLSYAAMIGEGRVKSL